MHHDAVSESESRKETRVEHHTVNRAEASLVEAPEWGVEVDWRRLGTQPS